MHSGYYYLVAHLSTGKRKGKGEWSMERKLVWQRNGKWRIESVMRDREKRIDHEIENGEWIVYSRKEN